MELDREELEDRRRSVRRGDLMIFDGGGVQLARSRPTVTKGMQMTSDCPVVLKGATPPKVATTLPDLSGIRARLDSLDARIKEAAAFVRKSRSS